MLLRKKSKKKPGKSPGYRADWIRTSGPLNPIQVRYQTALQPVIKEKEYRRSMSKNQVLFIEDFHGKFMGNVW